VLRSANGNRLDNFFAAKLRTLESEKLKKTCAKAGLVKKFV
jgi:hypothetical protein